ncbi:hypothetical protein OCUAc20_36260 [Acinetobacter baumannii]|nr:hypothetical protein OCUAc20_36260 [Acinetobacter baumannii]
MTIPDFIPQVGLRFSFKDTNFEVTYVHNNVVRFSAVDGGKTSNIPINSFSERYKTGEIQCTSSPISYYSMVNYLIKLDELKII